MDVLSSHYLVIFYQSQFNNTGQQNLIIFLVNLDDLLIFFFNPH